jgi:hypothetical protein
MIHIHTTVDDHSQFGLLEIRCKTDLKFRHLQAELKQSLDSLCRASSCVEGVPKLACEQIRASGGLADERQRQPVPQRVTSFTFQAKELAGNCAFSN